MSARRPVSVGRSCWAVSNPLSVKRWRRRRQLLALAAVLLLIIAASRPQYGRIVQTTRSMGTNVLIALDCSASMKAQDVPPSRIERAKQSLDLLLHQLGGNRAGIVAFAGVAFLQCPMTLDHGMAALILKSLDTDSISVPGTDIGEAIKVSTEAFERGAGEGGRALVLLTDGEDHGGKVLDMAREAAAKKIRIYAVGIGTSRGAPLIEEKGGIQGKTAPAPRSIPNCIWKRSSRSPRPPVGRPLTPTNAPGSRH